MDRESSPRTVRTTRLRPTEMGPARLATTLARKSGRHTRVRRCPWALVAGDTLCSSRRGGDAADVSKPCCPTSAWYKHDPSGSRCGTIARIHCTYTYGAPFAGDTTRDDLVAQRLWKQEQQEQARLQAEREEADRKVAAALHQQEQSAERLRRAQETEVWLLSWTCAERDCGALTSAAVCVCLLHRLRPTPSVTP